MSGPVESEACGEVVSICVTFAMCAVCCPFSVESSGLCHRNEESAFAPGRSDAAAAGHERRGGDCMGAGFLAGRTGGSTWKRISWQSPIPLCVMRCDSFATLVGTLWRMTGYCPHNPTPASRCVSDDQAKHSWRRALHSTWLSASLTLHRSRVSADAVARICRRRAWG